ncbi:CDP-alcohol phosphatidyltransferase family protein [Bacillus sp. FJAT-29790]|uniref:CDP-alcohol phosphatidyltransferase family protein n=1 Tax=Bacillus sp. FJAT-29790 TaxID=1895002 RepID=UPI001C237631|nr:CDP-alcohol phosphatidyltransferase family protein [Bacillus sp. FJAT-29790]MBU8881193.1 CDP-alcohol phosphatidyltransferase family protein [Bacillus sp. FJAT-29790]
MIVNKYKAFRSRYVVQKRRPEEYLFNKYYAHLIDPFFTKLAYDLNLKPNTVTVFSGILGICSGIAFIFGYYILGGILLQLHHLVDGADGNLARLTNQCSDFGAKLDSYTDQLVRVIVLVGIIFAANAPIWVDLLLILTFLLDILVVHQFVLPFMRKNGIVRSAWKQWFLNRGVIPAFDIFTIYFIISVFAVIQRIDILIYVLIVLKNIDWMYRVWECVKTTILLKRKAI